MVTMIATTVMILLPWQLWARDHTDDWYIKDFHATITVQPDSTLDITERITADCGSAADKHGIFRIVPTATIVEGRGTVDTPVTLKSITNAAGTSYKYVSSHDVKDRTVTWKIGDPDITVTGENVYVIHYTVKNAVRLWNADFDELYWNLTGNFWDLDIDHARVDVVLPAAVTRENATVDLYAGAIGNTASTAGHMAWVDDHTISFTSTKMLPPRHGLTASITVPKGIFTPYQPTRWERIMQVAPPLIPVAVFALSLWFWRKNGKDPRAKKTVIAQYEPPRDLSLLEIGMIMTNGKLSNHFITATLIGFATRGMMTIAEKKKKILMFSDTDYELTRTSANAEGQLTAAERVIMDTIFASGNVTLLSSLKDTFYKSLEKVRSSVNAQLHEKELLDPKGAHRKGTMIGGGIVMIIAGAALAGVAGTSMFFSLVVSGVTMILFGAVMPRRTVAGAEVHWHIKGFKLFMETVDKDRAKFYEKENIFEKFLPYAMLFEMTKEWIARMKEIYGEEYITSHAPTWYTAAAAGEMFNAETFSGAMTELSGGIGANTSSPSGSGGSGSSGGGGGGGGGGGW